MDGEIDYSQYYCQKCSKKGVCEMGMDVFVASLCEECFWKEWRGYLEAVSGREWTDEQARDAYYNTWLC